MGYTKRDFVSYSVLKDPGVDGRIILKMDRQEVGCGGHGLDGAGSGQGQVAGTCECGNESSGSIKYWEFLD